jgi:hypothetical protein
MAFSQMAPGTEAIIVWLGDLGESTHVVEGL